MSVLFLALPSLVPPRLPPPSSRNNRLQEVCIGLCSLKLLLLDLTNNDLRTLPPQLGLMNSLRSMPLDGNPLKLIRREVVAGGREVVAGGREMMAGGPFETSARAFSAGGGGRWAV